jgi:hypothetical protein
MSKTALQATDRSKNANDTTNRIILRYIVLAIVYLLLIVLLPGNKDFIKNHNLSLAEYHSLQFFVGLPLMAIWLVAFYGYAKLAEYTSSISKTTEAQGFRLLTQGIAWIAWSLPAYAIFNLVRRSLIGAHPGWETWLTIVVNYIDVLFPLVGFTLIGMASHHLFERAKMSLTIHSIRNLTLLFVIGGVLYCYLIFKQFSGGGLAATQNPFHMPVWLTVLTLVVPYLYAWFMGILAVYEMLVYCHQMRGLLYRQALNLLVAGLLATILGSIALEYARSTTQAIDKTHLLLGTFSVFSVIFQIISGIGFALIAYGARRLKKIEEV